MKKLIIIIAAACILNIANAENYKVISVYDGDTFKIKFNNSFTTNPSVRIRNIDAAEFGWRAKCKKESDLAIKAKTFLSNLILGKEIDLRDIGKDKYGRILADVFIDNKNVAELLIENSLAKPYTNNKINWCI